VATREDGEGAWRAQPTGHENVGDHGF